jgi:hypothetical protein
MPKYGLTAGVNDDNISTSLQLFMVAVNTMTDHQGKVKDNLAHDYIKPLCDYIKKRGIDPLEHKFSVRYNGSNQPKTLHNIIEMAAADCCTAKPNVDFATLKTHILTQFSDRGVYCSPQDKKDLEGLMRDSEPPTTAKTKGAAKQLGEEVAKKNKTTTSRFCTIS